jgi:hypothetical protein
MLAPVDCTSSIAKTGMINHCRDQNADKNEIPRRAASRARICNPL